MTPPLYHTEQAFRERMAQRSRQRRVPAPFAVFYHIAALHGPFWKDIVREQVADMIQAGITLDMIHACVLGGNDDIAWVRGLGLDVVAHQHNLNEHECFTLQRAYTFATENREGAILYVHTKGASAPWDPQKTAWRRLMMEAVAKRWREHLDTLSIADMVGLGWLHSPHHPHYSGNIWMARCDWLASLTPPLDFRDRGGPIIAGQPWQRMAGEMWLGSKPWHKMHCLAFDNWIFVGRPATFACHVLGIAAQVDPPTLHIITPLSRPENLAHVHSSIHHIRRCRVRWHVVADPAITLPERPPCPCVATWQCGAVARDVGGYAHRNAAIQSVWKTAGGGDWVYFLDDDNLLHQGFEDAFLDALALHPNADWFVFAQQLANGARRLAATDTPQPGHIDLGQCVLRLCCFGNNGDNPFIEGQYGEDGRFYTRLAETRRPVAIHRDATFYNALR